MTHFLANLNMPFTYDYPRPAVSADVVVLDLESDSILLIQRKKDPFAGSWALPGGFMDMDESADAAAIRELKEETGLIVSRVQQIGAYSATDRDPRGRVVTVAFQLMNFQISRSITAASLLMVWQSILLSADLTLFARVPNLPRTAVAFGA